MKKLKVKKVVWYGIFFMIGNPHNSEQRASRSQDLPEKYPSRKAAQAAIDDYVKNFNGDTDRFVRRLL